MISPIASIPPSPNVHAAKPESTPRRRLAPLDLTVDALGVAAAPVVAVITAALLALAAAPPSPVMAESVVVPAATAADAGAEDPAAVADAAPPGDVPVGDGTVFVPEVPSNVDLKTVAAESVHASPRRWCRLTVPADRLSEPSSCQEVDKVESESRGSWHGPSGHVAVCGGEGEARRLVVEHGDVAGPGQRGPQGVRTHRWVPLPWGGAGPTYCAAGAAELTSRFVVAWTVRSVCIQWSTEGFGESESRRMRM